MERSEFLSLTRKAKEIISSLSNTVRFRHERKELRLLSGIIDELERQVSKDPPMDWMRLANYALFVVESIKRLLSLLS